MKRIYMLSMLFIFLIMLSSCKDEENTEITVIDEILDVDFQYQYVNRQFISNNSCLS